MGMTHLGISKVGIRNFCSTHSSTRSTEDIRYKPVYPWSVKPDKAVSHHDVMAWHRDWRLRFMTGVGNGHIWVPRLVCAGGGGEYRFWSVTLRAKTPLSCFSLFFFFFLNGVTYFETTHICYHLDVCGV